jgi:hypothetical protein
MAAASPEISHVWRVVMVCRGSERTWAWARATCRKGASHARTMTSKNARRRQELWLADPEQRLRVKIPKTRATVQVEGARGKAETRAARAGFYSQLSSCPSFDPGRRTCPRSKVAGASSCTLRHGSPAALVSPPPRSERACSQRPCTAAGCLVDRCAALLSIETPSAQCRVLASMLLCRRWAASVSPCRLGRTMPAGARRVISQQLIIISSPAAVRLLPQKRPQARPAAAQSPSRGHAPLPGRRRSAPPST